MALASPLSIVQFWDTLRIASMSLRLHEPVEVNRTRSGGVITASLGDAIWRGTASLVPTNVAGEAARIEALLALLSRPGMAFLAYDARKPYPASDPDGSTYGASTPRIASINANRREVAFSKLPANYALKAGDLVGWQYGSSPTRYGLHRLMADVTANGSGTTAQVEVTPFIAKAVTTSTAVSFVKPTFKAVLDQPPDYGAGQPAVFPGAQFSFVQTLR